MSPSHPGAVGPGSSLCVSDTRSLDPDTHDSGDALVTLRDRSVSLPMLIRPVTYPYGVSGRHRILRVVAGVTSAGVLALTIGAGSITVAANHLEGNVTTIDISEHVGDREVDYGDLASGPVTVLLMGSDQRTGKGNKGYGYFEGARSDTTMLVHLYPDRQSAVVVSIPRDTVVDLPECVDGDGDTLPPVRERFNAAFDRGGPGCTVKAVEQMTGLTIDHFVVLDFNGFKKTIDALGGVEVCLTRPLQDSKSGVDLPAGRTRVTGEDALAFVRVRHNIGDGSDISRINRQQLFLSSLIQEVSSSGLLTDPIRMWRVLEESSKSIATDPALADTRGILALARSLIGLGPDDITFVTLPWVPSGDGATILPDRARAEAIWAALRAEEPWPPPPTEGADGERLTVAPARIVVDVHNATGTQGIGSRAAEDLAAQGFRIGVVNARGKVATRTTIRHSAAQLEAARTLQAALPGSVLVADADAGTRLDLTLGGTYDGVEEIRVKEPKSSASQKPEEGTTADQDICTG
jgi:LCP family protein required for cell wall assembly